MSYKTHRKILEWLVTIMLIIGTITAIFNLTFRGFTPVMWFVIAICGVLLVICTEVTQIQESMTKKK
jgi:nucleoside recognition membrane protein YjiH